MDAFEALKHENNHKRPVPRIAEPEESFMPLRPVLSDDDWDAIIGNSADEEESESIAWERLRARYPDFFSYTSGNITYDPNWMAMQEQTK